MCIYCPPVGWVFQSRDCCSFSIRFSEIPSASSRSFTYSHPSASFTPGPASSSLTQKCQFYLMNSLAPLTCPVYKSAQRQFIEFCTLDGHISSRGALLPTNEHTLLRFCSHLADQLHHSSIMVYLSAVRSLQIDYGFPDPLVHCLQLQHLLRGIKRHRGSHQPQRQHVTADLMHVIHHSVDLQNPYHRTPPTFWFISILQKLTLFSRFV